MIGVLVFIHEHMPKAAPILLAKIRECLQQMHSSHDQIVEIQRVRGNQASLVFPVSLRIAFLLRRPRSGRCGFMIDEFVLAMRHPVHDRPYREPLRIKIKIMRH